MKALRLLVGFPLGATLLLGVGKAQTIAALTSPSWGTVTEPTSGSVSYSLNPTTGLVNVLTGLGFLFNDGGAGSYLVSGSILHNFAYSVSIGAFTGSGVTVTSAYINGLSSSGSGTLSVLGTMTLKVGGVLSVASSATSGAHTATVTVTVNYT